VIGGVVLQKPGKTAQPVQDALAIIQTVHGEYNGLVSQLLPQHCRLLLHRRQRGCLVVQLVVDAHGEGIYMYNPVIQVDLIETAVQVEHPVDGTDEMAHIVVCVKADQVCTEQSLQHLLSFGEHPEKLVGGKRNVVKIADVRIRLLVANHLG